ncbi:MAG: hypothetical protein QOH22_1748 [Gemmatimonadaceae bacterium]|nr:hypothetical protein [Gemmatimonadaceae bacterium]
MKSRRTVFGHFASIALALAVAAPLSAQHSESMHVNVHVPDSVAHMVDRGTVERARFAIVSRDGASALLLMDTTIVAQMTDRGLARMSSREAVDTIQGVGNRLLARMVLGALQPVLDHGIAYHLRDMADARYADGRLQILRRNGEEVFRDTQLGHEPLMESFAPGDATAFARKAREARAKLPK